MGLMCIQCTSCLRVEQFTECRICQIDASDGKNKILSYYIITVLTSKRVHCTNHKQKKSTT